MKELIVVILESPSKILEEMIGQVVGNHPYRLLEDLDKLPDLQNKKVLFALELNLLGMSNRLNALFEEIYKRGHEALKDSEGAILIHSEYSSFTKSIGQTIAFLANNCGMSFPGRPLVEATKDFENFKAMERIFNKPLREICLDQCRDLGKRFLGPEKTKDQGKKNLLVLHSSNKDTSNTLSLWDLVSKNLDNININEINLGNGNILDCKGCSYKTCKHLGKQDRCFYGGIIVEEVYPAILEADSLLFLCPNYNDMLTANIVATINRLTALYRKTKFYDKSIFSIIVSGYSGGDMLARQLISSLNMNKTFRLPAYFSLLAVANHPGDLLKITNIEEKAKDFGEKIKKGI